MITPWLVRRLHVLSWIAPGAAINYTFLWLAGRVEIRSVAGFSVILIGDVMSLTTQLLLTDKFRKRLSK